MDHPEERLALIELLGRDGRVQRTLDVRSWPLTLGRALHNTLVLNDPHVAAQHATLRPDDEGRIHLQVGDTVNGVQLLGAGRRGRGAGQVLAAGAVHTLPAAGALLQVGGQRLRLRLPGETLPAEQPMARPAHVGRTLALLLAWLVLQVILRWVDLDPGADFTEWLPWLLGLPVGLATWCGLWAAGSKLFRHGFDFTGHAAIALPILLVMEALDLLLPSLAAGLGWPLLWHLQKLLVPALLVGWLLRSHLHHLLPQRGRIIDITLAVLIGAGLAVGVAINQRQQGRIFADPYMRTLPMPMLRFDAAVPTSRLDDAMLPLREGLADRLRKAAEDDPEGADERP